MIDGQTKTLKHNLSKKEFSVLQKSVVNKNNIHVINDTDKNLGAAVADKEDVIIECKRQLFDINTYLKLSSEEMEMLIARIQMELREVVNKYKKHKICNVKEENFILSKLRNFTIPHFYIIWKILKNPIVGRPIVAGYNWILTPASIFVGHYLKEFYCKFDSILTDSLSLVKILETKRFDKDCFLFTIDFKSLYTNIPVQDAINAIKELVWKFGNVIPNAEFIVELLDVILKNSLMTFDGEYFQQIFGVIMGTNVAPILANIYMATLENLLKEKSKTNTKIIWPLLFKRFIDDGFGITKANKNEFETWVNEFNLLRESITIDKFKYGNQVDFMDLFVFKGESFLENGIFDISVFQKEENKYMYIPASSGHQQHTINNFILGELRRYVRFNTIKKNFLKIKRKFFIRLRNRGYTKIFLARLFSKIKFGSRNKLLAISADNENYRETNNNESDTNLINDAERMFQLTFSEEEIPNENVHNNNNIRTCSVVSPISLCKKSKVSC